MNRTTRSLYAHGCWVTIARPSHTGSFESAKRYPMARATMTARAQAWQARLKALGVCPHCPPPRELLPINPRTGKRYHYCAIERERRRLRQMERRQKGTK